MDIEITKLSSKGQVVIPLSMREGMKTGDKLLVIKNSDSIILRKASTLEKKFEEDVRFAEKTEEALKRYEKGQFKKMSSEEFLKELKKW